MKAGMVYAVAARLVRHHGARHACGTCATGSTKKTLKQASEIHRALAGIHFGLHSRVLGRLAPHQTLEQFRQRIIIGACTLRRWRLLATLH